MASQFIRLRGARTHNLKNLNVDIPRNQLVVITGLSGSGKSSLAFDTLYAEGQRRYVESLSAYARQFLSMMEKPDIDLIEGLSPAISIEQKSTSHNPRSTVGTVTEIYDYLRLLFARTGEPCCPEHGDKLEAKTISQMVDEVLALPEDSRLMLLAPLIKERKGEHLNLIQNMQAQGFIRARFNGEIYPLDEAPKLEKNQRHTIELVVDRLKISAEQQQRLAESFETALALSGGLAVISFMDGEAEDLLFSANFACTKCGYALAELEPKIFSFNNPAGACTSCDGLGVKQFFDPQKLLVNPTLSLAEGAINGWDRRNVYYFGLLECLAAEFDFKLETPWQELPQEIQNKVLQGTGKEEVTFYYVNDKGQKVGKKHPFEGVIPNLERRYKSTDSSSLRENLAKYMTTQACPHCQGSRLKLSSRNVFVAGKSLSSLTNLPLGEAYEFFTQLKLEGKSGEIAAPILLEISQRLSFLVNVGLDYLSLDRSAETLSGGEAQRIRLASQIGAGLVGVMYILDEPSIGLHQRDNQRLLETLKHLRDLGNSVLVVEHDEDAIRQADWLLDIGPGAGVHGGELIASGTPSEVMQNTNSITADYLTGRKQIAVPQLRQPYNPEAVLTIHKASGNNLKDLTVSLPLGLLTCVTGVSGSGKSTLINSTLYPQAATLLNRATQLTSLPCEKITGLDQLDKVIAIDQSPIGRTPRSNPATYTGIFTPVRELFAGTPEARARGYKPGRFSFNVKGGRCEACQGDGLIKVEMHFLPDIYVNCDVCHGKRYNRESLEVTYKGKSIHQVLEMTVEDAREFFSAIPVVARRLQTLMDVGLSYIKLGQSATTLSGGEAQRVKLAKELAKRDTGKTLYILDEPTTGLHFEDIRQLLSVLQRLRDQGNTLIIIEHNLDVIKTADYILDIGPEGGKGGGELVAEGTPEEIAANPASYTGKYLAKLLF